MLKKVENAFSWRPGLSLTKLIIENLVNRNLFINIKIVNFEYTVICASFDLVNASLSNIKIFYIGRLLGIGMSMFYAYENKYGNSLSF